jgi:hypothetical protein
MQTFLQDVRYAIRLFARQPGFTAVAVLSLAIGIGANTAVFSVASALLLRPLPYAEPDRLAILWNRSPGLNIAEDWFSTAQYFDVRSNNTAFDDVAIALGNTVNLTGDGNEAERIGVIRVSSNLLPMLGARPALGRFFVPEDDVPGLAATAVLGHGTWVRRYGSDPEVLGRTIRLNGQPVEIVGVLPASFSLPREVLPTLGMAEDGEIFLPLPLAENAAQFRGREDYNILARLKPGATVTEAQAEMDLLTARLRREHPNTYPPNGGLTFSVVPLLDQVVGDVRPTVLILSGAVAFVRQRRQPAPGARRGTTPGDHGAGSTGRLASPDRASAAHGERPARRGGRRHRHRARYHRYRVDAGAAAAERAAPAGHRHHHRRSLLHRCRDGRVGHPVRPGACAGRWTHRPAVLPAR